MILTGSEDLRVRRTIDSIKSVFEQMTCEMDYGKIRVTELCQRAMINKKTFYVYYPTLDDLLAEIQAEYSAEYIERIKDYKLPDELDKVNREFFLFSEEKGLAYEKITCAGNESYHYIRSGMIKKVNTAGWSSSKKYGALPEYQQTMLMNFVNMMKYAVIWKAPLTVCGRTMLTSTICTEWVVYRLRKLLRLWAD